MRNFEIVRPIRSRLVKRKHQRINISRCSRHRAEPMYRSGEDNIVMTRFDMGRLDRREESPLQYGNGGYYKSCFSRDFQQVSCEVLMMLSGKRSVSPIFRFMQCGNAKDGQHVYLLIYIDV